MESRPESSKLLEAVEGFGGIDGKSKASELREFLREFFDNMKVAIWDGDNTLWNWMAYAVPAYEAMCEEIAKIANKSPEETAAAMKAFYGTVGTIEHEGLVQGLRAAGFFSHMPDFDLESTIMMAQRAFSGVRNERLNVYEGIKEVMEALKQRGIDQIIITDAPRVQAGARLHRSGLWKYVSRVYTMRAAELEVPAHLRLKFESNGVKFYELDHEKPNVDLEEILMSTKEEIAEEVGIFGDNDRKDMKMARMFGCPGFHMRHDLPRRDAFQRIAKFAPECALSRNMAVTGGADGVASTASTASTAKIIAVHNPQALLRFLK